MQPTITLCVFRMSFSTVQLITDSCLYAKKMARKSNFKTCQTCRHAAALMEIENEHTPLEKANRRPEKTEKNQMKGLIEAKKIEFDQLHNPTAFDLFRINARTITTNRKSTSGQKRKPAAQSSKTIETTQSIRFRPKNDRQSQRRTRKITFISTSAQTLFRLFNLNSGGTTH